ncbi:unnamed protein product [Amaranthus hypochondriacus]
MVGRGRGGRGGRCGGRTTTVQTRSASEQAGKEESAAGSLSLRSDSEKAQIRGKSSKSTPLGMEEHGSEDQLDSLRQQFNQLKELMDKFNSSRTRACDLLGSSDSRPDLSTVNATLMATNSTVTPTTSWRDKVQPTMSQKVMPLKYIAPKEKSSAGVNTGEGKAHQQQRTDTTQGKASDGETQQDQPSTSTPCPSKYEGKK